MSLFDFFKKKELKIKESDFKPFEVVKEISGSYENFYNNALRKSLIMLIIGKRGSGKTALGMRFLEMYRKNTNKKIYALGFEKSKLPWYIKKVYDIENIKNNSVLLIDEGAVVLSARESMKELNKFLSKTMAIARHKNLSLILITQNCMPLQTEIITEKGIKKLKDIRIGDKILSYNFRKKRLEFKETFISPIKKRGLIKIETKEGDIIECSPEHKLLVKKGKKIVKKKAKDLTRKDLLFKPLKVR